MNLSIDGVRVACEVYGEVGADLVVLHGWGANSYEWRAFAQLMSKQNRIWLINLPGFGGSDELSGEPDIKRYAEFVQKIIDQLGVQNYSLVGHSFGGRIAIALAETDSRVRKLVLVDAAGMAIPGLKVFLYGWLLKLLVIFWNVPVVPKKYTEHLTTEDLDRAQKMLPLFSRVVGADISTMIAKIKIPVLVVWGLWDMALPVWEGVWLYKSLPDARFRILPYSAHVPHVEETKRLVGYLQEFKV